MVFKKVDGFQEAWIFWFWGIRKSIDLSRFCLSIHSCSKLGSQRCFNRLKYNTSWDNKPYWKSTHGIQPIYSTRLNEREQNNTQKLYRQEVRLESGLQWIQYPKVRVVNRSIRSNTTEVFRKLLETKWFTADEPKVSYLHKQKGCRTLFNAHATPERNYARLYNADNSRDSIQERRDFNVSKHTRSDISE